MARGPGRNKALKIEPSHQASKSDEVTRAMGFMVCGMLIVPIMDALAKILSTRYGMSPAMITWSRFLGQASLLLIIIPLWLGSGKLNAEMKGMNIFRGALIGLAVTFFFLAIKYLPLADAIAIFFVEPLILMFLSVLFLGEKIGWRRISAAIFGFLGALLVIQPTYEVFGWISLVPIAAATFFAIYLMMSRQAGSIDHPLVMQLWSGIGGVMICSLILFMGETAGEIDFMVTWPQSGSVIALLIAIIAVGTLSHLLIVVAFTKAQASILAPFQYLEIITMTMLGYWIFGDFPSFTKWIGIAMIVSSGIYVFYRENKVEKSLL